MKKMMVIILVAILLAASCASAEDEILFQRIPWLSDDAETIKILYEAGFIRSEILVSFTNNDGTYLVQNDIGMVLPDRIAGANDVIFSASLSEHVKGKIGGYPVKDLSLTFAYDGSFKLIAMKVELIGAKYDDLRNKLIKVYGEGKYMQTEEGIESTVWEGSNNSAVVLYSDSEGINYSFMYGCLNAKEIINNCLTNIDPEDVSGL